MKKLSLIVVTALMASLGIAQGINFTVTGHIKGLERGDTIRFERLSLPSWEKETAFDVIVTETDEFSYKGSHPHTQIYSMRYIPVGKPITNQMKISLSVLIKGGETRLTGERDMIYYALKSGEMYDTQLQTIDALEDSLDKERSLLMQKIDIYRHNKDTTAAQASVDDFNNFHSENSAHFDRLKAMRREYAASSGNEYTAYQLCTESSRPLSVLEKGYESLKIDARESHYGKLLCSIIEKIRSLEPGNNVPDFRLTTLKGETITPKDFGGKYLLIYHFGLCPGSMQADPQVKKLHDEYGNRVEIVGITESMGNLKNIAAQAKEGDMAMGMDFRTIMTGMTNHPWRHEAETTGDNSNISDIFNIQGLPFFICISPDGKIVSRGFFEAFEEAKKAIQQN